MKIELDIIPVGVKFLDQNLLEWCDSYDYTSKKVISFCDGVLRLRNRKIKGGILLTEDSIQICKWAPIVLGFKKPESFFEKTISPTLKPTNLGVFMFNIDEPKVNLPFFEENKLPDTVLIRTTQSNIRTIINYLGVNQFTKEYIKNMDASAISMFLGKSNYIKIALITLFNGLLHKLDNINFWKRITTIIFKSKLNTLFFDMLIKALMSDMSMCRNNSVIPYLTNKGNVSFFCSGGIAWGENTQNHMPIGLPYELFSKLDGVLYINESNDNLKSNESKKLIIPPCQIEKK